MRARVLVIALALAAACGSGGNAGQDARSDGHDIDAPMTVPTMTSFLASPSQLQAGVATTVTWNWTYEVVPTLPDPSCTIDNGVGTVMRGQATMVTISAVTTFTLTCTNSAGSGSRQVVIGVPPVAPSIATFTASPALVTSNAATPVTWTWTYTTPPSPAPACTIEHGVGAVTSGSATAVTLSQARTFRLRCTNSQGSSTAQATVSVDECADATADCQTNATCTDTIDSLRAPARPAIPAMVTCAARSSRAALRPRCAAPTRRAAAARPACAIPATSVMARPARSCASRS
jgi:plastocyanin